MGLARFISDYATFCYVCDVYVLEEYRGRGLSKAMMAFAVDHPRLQGLRRWSLVTGDAHGLYRQFGFTSWHGRRVTWSATMPRSTNGNTHAVTIRQPPSTGQGRPPGTSG